MPRAIATLLGLVLPLGIASSAAAADEAKVTPLARQALPDLGSKEGLVLTVEYRPGQSSAAHRHNAHTFVYVLQGAVMMGVNGRPPVRLEAGQTFYEAPGDVHTESRNASDSVPAKFVVVMIKEKDAPPTVPAK